MKTLTIKTKQKIYPVYIGQHILSDTALLKKHLSSHQVLIVTNKTIASHYLEKLKQNLKAYQVESLTLPDGEQFKTLDHLKLIFDKLIEHHFKRDATLIALGGGVIGDMTGFAASCYQRGMPFIQIPTTSLAQIDASIGGKTAVNYENKKNFIGSFYQPTCVVIDINTLDTLPKREFISGLAEVIKHAAICDESFFTWLEKHMPDILTKQPHTLIEMLNKSAKIKANIVSEDEQETKGTRELLNFGHTFAHAIESATDYQVYLHGEAVSIGMVMAAELSKTQGLLNDEALKRLKALLIAATLPVALQKTIDDTTLQSLMSHDKKHRANQKRFVLLNKIGNASVSVI